MFVCEAFEGGGCGDGVEMVVRCAVVDRGQRVIVGRLISQFQCVVVAVVYLLVGFRASAMTSPIAYPRGLRCVCIEGVAV